LFQFGSDQEGKMATVSGTVMRYGSAERIAGACVKVSTQNQKPIQVVPADDGDYIFHDLVPGNWSFVVFHESSFPSAPIAKDIMADTEKFDFQLQRLAGQEDRVAGQKFFFWLLGSLSVLIVAYVILHLFLPPVVVGTPLTFQLWDKDPLRFLEIMLWGLAGVLVNKIIDCGWFLRSQRFYREGIVMHIAHLVSTPLLVLVAVILLSLATFKITLTGGSEVTIDLSQPTVMIAIAFLLGSSPWPLWNLIERASRKITGQAEK
jgi:hypothetical protein